MGVRGGGGVSEQQQLTYTFMTIYHGGSTDDNVDDLIFNDA